MDGVALDSVEILNAFRSLRRERLQGTDGCRQVARDIEFLRYEGLRIVKMSGATPRLSEPWLKLHTCDFESVKFIGRI